MKRFMALILMCGLLLCLFASQAMAEINWAAMSNEDIEKELQAGKKELLSRGGDVFELGKPILIEDKHGTYLFTLDGAHIIEGSKWEKAANKKSADCVMISLQGVCENIDCNWWGDYGYVPAYQIQQDIVVADPEGFSLEVYDASNGEDGRYEVGAHIDVGTKKRVSMIFYAFTDTTSVFVSIPGHDGIVEIKIK